MDIENIKVALRMRPVLEQEKSESDKKIWDVNHKFVEVNKNMKSYIEQYKKD